jgi:hypothetical protein
MVTVFPGAFMFILTPILTGKVGFTLDQVELPAIIIVVKDPAVPLMAVLSDAAPANVRFPWAVMLNAPFRVMLDKPFPILNGPCTTQLPTRVATLADTFNAFIDKALGHVLPLLVRVVVPLPLVIKPLAPATVNVGDAERVTEWPGLPADVLPTVMVLFMVMVLA